MKTESISIISALFVLTLAILTTFAKRITEYFIEKQEFKFLLSSKKRTIKVTGKAEDIDLNNISKDFSCGRYSSYLQEELAKIIIFRHSIVVELPSMKMQGKGAKDDIISLKGKGPFVNGMGYILYSARSSLGGDKWNGLMALSVPSNGPIKGYWLTENTTERGPFSFVKVELEKDMSEK